jgi:hypothetical protein
MIIACPGLPGRRAPVTISSSRSKIRLTVAVLSAAAVAVAAAVTVLTKPNVAEAAGEVVAAALVEDEGADCPVPGSVTLTANSRLPDPFRR